MRATPEELLRAYELAGYAPAILRTALPCVRGKPCDTPSRSYAGGLPLVDDGFVWPHKNGEPLQFVAQIEASASPLWNRQSGIYLFFYHDRYWGGSPKDRGHAAVIWQQGQRALEAEEMPRFTRTRNWLLWKSTSVKSVRITRQVYLEFQSSSSFPSLDREMVRFPGEAEEEAYNEFLAALESPIQLGGYPCPIQSDDMESDCARCVPPVPERQWSLLLQSQEVGDQRWGDAGCLYWFIPQEDLQTGRLDRIWLVSQCF